MQKTKVWDPVVRLFHWSLVVLFTANAFLTEGDHTLHHWIGYIIAGLIGLRLVWGIVGARHARFTDFPPSWSGATEQLTDIATGRRRIHTGHTPLGALMIYNLLLTLSVICVSGWLMTTNTYWGVEWPEEIHEAAVVWAEISVVVHVAAVVFETVRTGVNLPRAMVTGYKDLPPQQR